MDRGRENCHRQREMERYNKWTDTPSWSEELREREKGIVKELKTQPPAVQRTKTTKNHMSKHDTTQNEREPRDKVQHAHNRPEG